MRSEGKIYWIGVTTAIIVYILGVSSGVAEDTNQSPNQSLSQLLVDSHLHKGLVLGGLGAFLILSATYFKSPTGGIKDLKNSPFGHKILFVLSGAITGGIITITTKQLFLSFVAGVSWPTVVTGYQGLSGVVMKAVNLYLQSRENEGQAETRNTPTEADTTKNEDDEKDEKAEDNNDTNT